jgi:hypothetical protein
MNDEGNSNDEIRNHTTFVAQYFVIRGSPAMPKQCEGESLIRYLQS